MSDPVQVLITGAAGFGGASLTRELLGRGYAVTGLDVTPPAHAALLEDELAHPSRLLKNSRRNCPEKGVTEIK